MLGDLAAGQLLQSSLGAFAQRLHAPGQVEQRASVDGDGVTVTGLPASGEDLAQDRRVLAGGAAQHLGQLVSAA